MSDDTAAPQSIVNSPNQSKLFESLSKAQGEVDAALKTAENAAFQKNGKVSTYADIAEVIEVIREPALKNGLAVYFDFKTDFLGDRPHDFIKYRLSHASGEFFDSQWLLMRMRGVTSHDFGAANTYYRRQILKSIYQIPEEDDDGNKSSGVDTSKKKPDEKSDSVKQNSKTQSRDPALDALDPAFFKLTFGKDTKGKMVKEIPEKALVKAYEWAMNEIKEGRANQGMHQSVNAIAAFLTSVGAKP